ncbi:Hypothetical Protein FCC1311_097042 [Hondaea fermentalgiana]|uniref:HTH CENPB-type domain-containing protein n=1 Tax=Hondaea fermentalgiana TaxID=2315210 RepID=A0A2R5GYE8_9STRA|nr:Hypothetical Protein FCC1311_097042 [Hondaea fermentalgiana]|eukprot:GBG33481.1 Hypothetical Protein FCC1311_097042 [Hondaea fermentalgiana]
MSQRVITSFFASPPEAVDGPGEKQTDEVASKFPDLLALAEPPAKRARGRPKGSSNAVVQDGFNAPSSTAECPGACVDEASNLGDAVDLETDNVLDTSTPQKRRRGKYNSLKDPKYLAVAQEAVDRALGNGNFSSTVKPSLAWIIDHYSRSSDYRFNRWTLTRLIEEAKKNGGRLQPYETALTHSLEQQLKELIAECSKTGMPLSAKDIQGMAYDLARLKDSNTKFKATNGWWKSFKARHPDLRIRRREDFDTMSHRTLNYDIASEWFDLVQHKYAEVHLGENTVFDIYGIPVANTSLLKLYDPKLDAKDQAWITDDIMNSMGRLICANSIRSMVMVDTNVAAMWARDEGKGRAPRGSSNQAAQQAKRLLEHDVICFPCNPSSAHWSVIFIFVKERRFEYFDPLGCEAQEWKGAAVRFLNDCAFQAYPEEQIDRDASTWPFVNTFAAAVQRDQVNCGIRTLIGMEIVARSDSPTSAMTLPSEAILAFRCKYFCKLLRAAAWEEKDTDVNETEESSEESTDNPSLEAQGGSRVRGGDGGESATALITLLAEMKKMMKDLKERELAAAASTSHQTIINNYTNIQIGSADARPLIEKAYGKLISSSGCTGESQDDSLQEKRKSLLDVLFKDVGGADFVFCRERVSTDSWRPKDMYDLEQLEAIEAQDKSREAVSKAKKAEKDDKQFVEEAGVRAILLQKANENSSFEFGRDDKITRTKLMEVLQLAGKRVPIQPSRQELLELVRSLSASSEEHVSEEASSSRELNPSQNADEVPAGTPESVPDTMEEEDLVKAALFANAALSGYTGGKLKRCHLPVPVSATRDEPSAADDGHRADGDEEELGLRSSPGNNIAEEIHFTHVFNSFNVSPGSKLSKEHDLVRLSWQLAAEYALQEAGIRVEFINAVLSEDRGSGPAFAREIDLKDVVIDPFNHHKLPVVGEIFRVGRDHGTGKHLIYTNADIGVHQDFYVQAWKLAHLDGVSIQDELLAETFELLLFCLSFDETGGAHITTPLLCQNDARVYYKLHGGDIDLIPLAMQDLAHLYVQNRTRQALASRQSSPPSAATLRSWFEDAGGQGNSPQSTEEALQFQARRHERPANAPYRPSAFTITRMDLRIDENKLEVNRESLEYMLATAKASPHPGNDCFILPRTMVPNMLAQSRHPLSWRPWGMWIPWSFEWELSSEHLTWRRFEGTERRSYTFHLGVSGRVANKWIELWNQRPMFILGLAASWNEVTGDRFVESFHTPKYCSHEAAYRHFAFCNAAPAHMRYCQGNVRYGCSEFNHPHLRDPYNYSLMCDRLLRRALASKSQPLVPPFCSFCAKLMKAHGGYTASRIQLIDKKCAPDLRIKQCFPSKCEFTPSSQQLQLVAS